MATHSVSVAQSLASIRRRIAEACERVGRDPSSVTLLGASKRQPLEHLIAAHSAGLRVFGENRVQEAQSKQPQVAAHIEATGGDAVEWHLIGPLQSNKAKVAARLFDVIHSVDRPKIARALDREARALDRRIPYLLEVNLGREESKHGFDPEGLVEATESLADLEGLELRGLMAIPPFSADPEATRPWFAKLRELRDELAAQPRWAGFAGWLSMGMSGDFDVAIEEGATHVRVGTLLFGQRPPLPKPNEPSNPESVP